MRASVGVISGRSAPFTAPGSALTPTVKSCPTNSPPLFFSYSAMDSTTGPSNSTKP